MNITYILAIALSLWVAASCPTTAQEWPLEKCLAYAVQHNRQLAASREEATAAAWDKKAAQAGLLPELTGVASMDHYWKIPVQVFPGELLGQPEGSFVPVRLGTPWMGNYGVEAALDIVNPATWQQIKLAAIRSQMATDGHQSTERLLLRNVQMAYHAAAVSGRSLELVESRAMRLREVETLIAQQFDRGVIDKISLNQCATLVNSLEATEKAAQASFQAALLDLKFWMGYPLDSALHIASFDRLPEARLSGDPVSVQALPEYARYAGDHGLAVQEWQASRAALWPTLTLQAGYNRLGFGASWDAMARSDWFPSGYVGLRLRMPILSIGKMVHAPSRYRALAEAARWRLLHYEESESRRVKQEQVALGKALEALHLQEDNVMLARENEDLAYQKLEKGIIDMVELKETQQELDEAIRTLIDARLEYLKHHVELDYLQNQQQP